MLVAVTSSSGLPDTAYLSVRVGETRRQAPFKKASNFHFPEAATARSLNIDIFERLGSAQVSLSAFTLREGSKQTWVSIPRECESGNSPRMELNLQMQASETSPPATPSRGEVVVKKGVSYMETSGLQDLLGQLIKRLMMEQPADYLQFMADWVAERQAEAQPAAVPAKHVLHEAAGEAPAPEELTAPLNRRAAPLSLDALNCTMTSKPSLDPMNCTMTRGTTALDLSEHSNLLAEALQADPTLAETLQGKSTKLGVDLALITRPGLENKGHKLVKSAGVVAGDAESYEVFAPLYEAILSLRFGPLAPDHRQPLADLSTELAEVAQLPIDPAGGHILKVQLRLSRNLAGLRFPPACSLDERRQVERSLVTALNGLDGDLAGSYYPVSGSDSFASKPGGASEEELSGFRSRGMLFREPDSAASLSSGLARDWPDARGVFAADTCGFWAWVNEEDHLKLFAQEMGPDIGACCRSLCRAETALSRALAEGGHSFARHERYGYLTTGPTNSGTTLYVTALVKLPLVSARPDFRGLCKRLRLQTSYQRRLGAGVWLVANMDRAGCSEVEQVRAVADGCRQLIAEEVRLEREREEEAVRDRILAVRLRLGGGVDGLPELRSCASQERRQVEDALTKALLELPEPWSGDYYPLPGSSSFAPKPGGMGEVEAALLQQCGLVLEAPEGLDQDWPDARGVFASSDGELAAWVNRLDHLSILSRVEGRDVGPAVGRLRAVESALKHKAEELGHTLSFSAAPSVRVALLLPKLAADSGALAALCTANGLVLAAQSSAGIVEVASLPGLGVSEEELVVTTVAACAKLVTTDLS